jgi:hypothetical protein
MPHVTVKRKNAARYAKTPHVTALSVCQSSKNLVSIPPIPIIPLDPGLRPLHPLWNLGHLRHPFSIRHNRHNFLFSKFSFRAGFGEARGLALYYFFLDGLFLGGDGFGVGGGGVGREVVRFRVCGGGCVGWVFCGVVVVGGGEYSALFDDFLAGCGSGRGRNVWALGGRGRGGLCVGGDVAVAEDLRGVSLLAGVGCRRGYLEDGERGERRNVLVEDGVEFFARGGELEFEVRDALGQLHLLLQILFRGGLVQAGGSGRRGGSKVLGNWAVLGSRSSIKGARRLPHLCDRGVAVGLTNTLGVGIRPIS